MDVDKYLSKEVFEVHIKYNRDSLEELKKSSHLIFHKLDDHEKTLYRNTASLEEHKKRSLHREDRQDAVIELINETNETLIKISCSMEKIIAAFVISRNIVHA